MSALLSLLLKDKGPQLSLHNLAPGPVDALTLGAHPILHLHENNLSLCHVSMNLC